MTNLLLKYFGNAKEKLTANIFEVTGVIDFIK